MRSNLDPHGEYEDAAIWSALRRASLLDGDRFNLETRIEEEGANLSQGERALFSLARALVKDSIITVLDEATASVDVETVGHVALLSSTINY